MKTPARLIACLSIHFGLVGCAAKPTTHDVSKVVLTDTERMSRLETHRADPKAVEAKAKRVAADPLYEVDSDQIDAVAVEISPGKFYTKYRVWFRDDDTACLFNDFVDICQGTKSVTTYKCKDFSNHEIDFWKVQFHKSEIWQGNSDHCGE